VVKIGERRLDVERADLPLLALHAVKERKLAGDDRTCGALTGAQVGGFTGFPRLADFRETYVGKAQDAVQFQL
jgi:hypothetical protein